MVRIITWNIFLKQREAVEETDELLDRKMAARAEEIEIDRDIDERRR